MKNQEPRTENRYSYRNLILWEKGQELALDVIRLVAELPADRVTDVIIKQILRSVFSISANVAEGHGRYSLGAHRNHLTIAKGSASETDNFLDLLRRAEYISTEREARLHSQCDEIIRMLVSKILQLERMERAARKPSQIAEEVADYVPMSRYDSIDHDPAAGWDESDYLSNDTKLPGSRF